MILRYIELDTGANHNGPAWIAHVTMSRSFRTVYFNGRALQSSGRGYYGDVESREVYWISGVKKRGTNRHWAGSGIMIEETAVAEYLALTEGASLDESRFVVIPPLPATDVAKITALENASPYS
jgi:hypothetical protein